MSEIKLSRLEAKQVLVVRKDLKMRKGKIAAQCAHASMKVLLDIASRYEIPTASKDAPGILRMLLTYTDDSPLHAWIDGSFGKICVYVNSEEELDALAERAKQAMLLHSMIVDQGRTEFHGVPTKTVLAIGPGWVEEIDKVTGHLPLL